MRGDKNCKMVYVFKVHVTLQSFLFTHSLEIIADTTLFFHRSSEANDNQLKCSAAKIYSYRTESIVNSKTFFWMCKTLDSVPVAQESLLSKSAFRRHIFSVLWALRAKDFVTILSVKWKSRDCVLSLWPWREIHYDGLMKTWLWVVLGRLTV